MTSRREASTTVDPSRGPAAKGAPVAICSVDASGVITRYAGDSFPELNLCCPQETIGRSIDATALWLADAVRQSLDSGETSFGVGEAGERRYECRCFVERATEAGPTVATVWILSLIHI